MRPDVLFAASSSAAFTSPPLVSRYFLYTFLRSMVLDSTAQCIAVFCDQTPRRRQESEPDPPLSTPDTKQNG